MRALVLRVILGTATLAASVARVSIAVAQMHKVAKPQQVVRAIGVYEWTGDFGKPTASRLIPVSLYIEGKFEDAGVYIARPVPFALLSGNVYILQTAGVDKGTLDLAYARHLQAVEPTGDMAFDDGWFGYGSVKPLAAPRKTTTAALKPSKTVPAITTTSDPNRPHFGSKPTGDTTSATGGDQSKPDTTASGTKSTSTGDDSDRPTMKRRSSDTTSSGTTSSGTTSSPTAADSGSTPSTSSAPSDDPNRPTMKRRSPDTTTSGSDTTTTASNTQTGSTPADDPDRPTMKRRSPDTTTSGTDTTASSSQTGNAPADDPDRPTMKRGSSSGNTTTDTASTTSSGNAPADDPDRPTLKRHSAEDARRAASAGDIGGGGSVESLNNDPNRPNLHHGKPVSSMTEEDLPKLTGIPPNLHQMVAVSDAVNRDPHLFTLEWDDETQHQAILQKMQALARTQLAAYATTPATATSAAASPAKKTPPASTRSHRTPAAAPPLPLFDEQLKAYTLSYGGDPTYVYSANTGGTGAALRYVTIVAQADSLGEIKPAIQSVTDAAHLYRTPKMQFIDVVDAEASNRASLLFELRSQNARQFALYRVIAAHPEQIFLTGTTQ